MDIDEVEDATTSSYAKFKTQNEIDPDLIEKYAPSRPALDNQDELIQFGSIV